jgi:uncharacterized membrane protein
LGGLPRPPRPHIHLGGGGFFRRPVIYRGGGSGFAGCAGTSLVALLVILILVFVMFSSCAQGCSSGANFIGGSSNITASTVEREPLPAGSVNETGYYTDNAGWIKNGSRLTTGLRNFYNRTGVQPYLYITTEINGSKQPTEAEVRLFAEQTYSSLFTDEAHLLFIFFEPVPESYHMWHMGGTMTKTILDDEAMNILYDYVERYYYSDYSEEEYFSKAFDEASERIMSVTKSPWPVVIIVLAAVLALFLLFVWRQNVQQQKKAEAEQTERILSTPLETFDEGGASNLAKKYEDK